MSGFMAQGCYTKKFFATKSDARRAFPSKRVYRCPMGEHYHVRSKIAQRHVR